MREVNNLYAVPMKNYEMGNSGIDYAISHTDYHRINPEVYVTEAEKEEEEMNHFPKTRWELFVDKHFKH